MISVDVLACTQIYDRQHCLLWMRVSRMMTMNAFACSVHVICYSVSGAWIYLQESGLAQAHGVDNVNEGRAAGAVYDAISIE